MALQCITIVWPKTHQNCQRERGEVNGFLVFALEGEKQSTCWLHCQGHSKQCHMAVVAVRWKVLAVPELAWKRNGSRSVLFPPFTWICWHSHLGHCSINDIWESDQDSDKPLWLHRQAGPRQSDRMRLGNCRRCRQGRKRVWFSVGGYPCNSALLQSGWCTVYSSIEPVL